MGRRLPVPSMCHRHRRAPVVLIQPSQTETNAQGQSTTTVWRAIRANKEDRVAKLEWAPGGGLGRAVIGKVRTFASTNFPFDVFLTLPFDHPQNHVPMADLVRRDSRMPVRVSVFCLDFVSI